MSTASSEPLTTLGDPVEGDWYSLRCKQEIWVKLDVERMREQNRIRQINREIQRRLR